MGDILLKKDIIFESHKSVLCPVDKNKYISIRRIYCVGANYTAHAEEMGRDPKKDKPFFFSKPHDALTDVSKEKNTNIYFPSKTSNLHHEIEMVVAIGKECKNISKEDAQSSIFAYGVGVDLTRRDIQMDARQKGRPWDMAKGFDQSALVGTLSLSKDCNSIENSKIWLKVNGVLKQYSEINKMIWSSAEIISFLSEYVQLMPGDLIFTGTPEGVGSLKKGDLIEGGISGLNEIKFMLDN